MSTLPTDRQQEILSNAILSHLQKLPYYDFLEFVYQGQQVFIIDFWQAEKGEPNRVIVRCTDYKKHLRVGNSLLMDAVVKLADFKRENPTAAVRINQQIKTGQPLPEKPMALYATLTGQGKGFREMGKDGQEFAARFATLPHEKQMQVVMAIQEILED